MAALALLAAAVLAFQAAPTALAQDGAAGWKRLGREAAVPYEKGH